MKNFSSQHDAERPDQPKMELSENEISKQLLNIFIRVHSKLGPGLFEKVYETIICYELKKLGLSYQRQQKLPVIYDDIKFEQGFRTDIIVENKVIVEIKSVEHVIPLFHKQLMTYLKLTGLKLGLLVNFNSPRLIDGYARIVNNL